MDTMNPWVTAELHNSVPQTHVEDLNSLRKELELEKEHERELFFHLPAVSALSLHPTFIPSSAHPRMTRNSLGKSVK